MALRQSGLDGPDDAAQQDGIGARFVIDPDRPRDLQVLRIQVNANDAEVTLDGTKLPVTLEWPLATGEHTLVALRGAQASKPVRIVVR